MHSKVVKGLFVVVVGASLAGCAPKPEEVCAHVEEVAKKDNQEPIKNCKFRMTMKYDTSREEYDALAPCLMDAASIAAINSCLETHQK